MTTEMKRIVRSACRRAINLEQQHWPRRLSYIERSLRLARFAERVGAYDRG